MANELTVAASLTYADTLTSDQLSVIAFAVSPSSLKPVRLKQTVSHTADTTLNLGDTSAPGYCLIVNRDTSNYVEMKTASSGTIFAKLLPGGGCALVMLGSGAQAPAGRANSGDCLIESFVIPT